MTPQQHIQPLVDLVERHFQPKQRYHAEGGTIRIDSSDMCLNFPNLYGDGDHNVDLAQQLPSAPWQYVGSFGIKTSATISAEDCHDIPLFAIERGYYQVFANHGDILIVRRGNFRE